MVRHALFLLVPLVVAPTIGCAGDGGQEVDPETADAVRQRIEARLETRNDTLRIPRPGDQDTVALAFDHVHETVRSTPGGRYAACVDFHGPDGEVWDLDYYVDDETGEFEIEDVVIHKVGDETVLPDGARRNLDQAR